MTELMELLMDMRKEVRCADKYAKEAQKHRHEYPELAQVYHRVSTEKLSHADLLAAQAKMMAEKNNMGTLWEIEDTMFEMDKTSVLECLNRRH